MTVNKLISLLQTRIDPAMWDKDCVNLVLTNSEGGLYAITGIGPLMADAAGDLYISLDTDEVII